ncbi:AraC-like DNA-binding protein [Dyadobacter jejuensis]|uniref:AraC-like DNA-binding protein n=1 Tax=Dyadobacter jejuensis TaxID=1082580 RepID=A0A316ALF7_9BACT|nr:AraC family transcriptional regulator [Dyadobacter jejuensis]PWJ58391.1 AraC-like DNA-binding protein [Dyadobacter jejuensis]
MKPQLIKVPKATQNSFSIRRDVVLYFYDRWHYHPEMELVLIEQGSGRQFIGDNIQNFHNGDLLLIGPNLPHYWRCDDKYFEGHENLHAQATVLHFLPDLFGTTFLELPENKPLRDLFQKAASGLKFNGKIKEQVIPLMQQLLRNPKENRIILLLQILNKLAFASDTVQLSNDFNLKSLDPFDTDRINAIYSYTLQNFQKKISIAEIADIANISPHSFCRYFKSRSRKTYSQFLIELRIGHACKLLLEEKWPVAQICFESGFNNFANFNKCFKNIMGISPLQYQKNNRY